MASTAKKAGITCSVMAIIGIVINQYPDQIRTNEAGLELIGNAEQCRRDPYVCPAGKLTDGLGNTVNVKQGTVKTNEQIAADWVRNIKVAEQCVNKYSNGSSLNDNQFSAMTEVTFNAGCANMQRSTMFRLNREGKFTAACNELPKWVYAAGIKLPGLVTRREKSKQLCLTKPID